MVSKSKQTESRSAESPELEVVIQEPLSWTHNWVRNFNLIKQWTQAVLTMAKIDKTDYEKVRAFELMRIEDKEIRQHLENGISNFGLLLLWIENGIKLVNECEHVPGNCILSFHNLTKHNKSWRQHITNAYNTEQLKELIGICKSLIHEIETKLDVFERDAELLYSSYSDYSESSYESDDEEEKKEDEDNEDDDDDDDDDEDDDDDDDDEDDDDERSKSPRKRQNHRRRR